MRFQAALGSLRMIGKMGSAGYLEALGISTADYNRFCSDVPWVSSERNRMAVILQSLVYASVDALGLPRFQLPAEYLAAAICVFVSPVNVHVACVIAPDSRDGEMLSRGVDSPRIMPSQLFALVCQLYDTPEKSQAKVLFDKNVGLVVEKEALRVKTGEKNNGTR